VTVLSAQHRIALSDMNVTQKRDRQLLSQTPQAVAESVVQN
jgi:hypothetical protein